MLKDIKVVSYNYLPCEAETFEVNGIYADKSDFGSNRDLGSFDYEYGEWDDENWACADNQFVANEEPPEGVLEKYGISLEEYRDIQVQLGEKFRVGSCGYCV